MGAERYAHVVHRVSRGIDGGHVAYRVSLDTPWRSASEIGHVNSPFCARSRFWLKRWYAQLPVRPVPPPVAITAAIVTAVAGAVSAGLQAFAAQQQPLGTCAIAVTVSVTVALAVGCCCGFGWGLALGTASPRVALQAIRIGSRLAESAAFAPPARARQPAARPTQLRRPAFLEDFE